MKCAKAKIYDTGTGGGPPLISKHTNLENEIIEIISPVCMGDPNILEPFIADPKPSPVPFIKDFQEDWDNINMSLEDFLKDRGVPLEHIYKMNTEKIDVAAIKTMSDEDLKKYLPAHGDRLAVRSFINKSRRTSLIEKLRRSYDSFGGTDQAKKKSRVTNYKGKNTRKIEIGWMIFDKKSNRYKQVRGPVGGNRKIVVEKSCKAEDIRKKAEELFFPGGSSVHGALTDFKVELLDYKSHPIIEINVEEMYERTGMTALRFYLATKKRASNEDEEYRPLSMSPVAKNDDELAMSLRPMSNKAVAQESDIENLMAELDSLPDVTARDYFSNFLEDPHDFTLEAVHEEQTSNVDRIPTHLVLRRGFIFEDLLMAFKTHKFLSNIDVEIILPNGQKEVAEDVGGVLRDALSEFWATFYEKCTIGTAIKVPCLRDDFSAQEWEAISRVIGKGWEEQKYFPIKLSKVFIKNCLGQSVSDDELITDFFRYISKAEKDTIQKALAEFESVEIDEILEIFGNFDCKRQITPTNITSVLKGVAEKELIQKPEFVSKCFARTKEIEKVDGLDNLYSTYEPSAKNVLARIYTSSTISSENQERVFSFLRKYIREADSSKREALLRFCTGSDVLINNISVSFNSANGMQRLPIGHTCGCILELPDTYPDFVTFRSEMNNILSSNIWIMDMI